MSISGEALDEEDDEEEEEDEEDDDEDDDDDDVVHKKNRTNAGQAGQPNPAECKQQWPEIPLKNNQTLTGSI